VPRVDRNRQKASMREMKEKKRATEGGEGSDKLFIENAVHKHSKHNRQQHLIMKTRNIMKETS
jgi:hypothetical protein